MFRLYKELEKLYNSALIHNERREQFGIIERKGVEIIIKIIVDSQYHRDQFDDWLAGGKVEYKRKIHYWSAQNSNYGFGWEIQPVSEEDWDNIAEDEFNKIINLIESCLYEHRTDFVF